MADRFPSFAGLKAFYAVAASGGVAKAAERLGITPSAVSHQLKSLEAELGVRLFDHKKGKLHLSSDGTQYFEAVEHPMANIQKATEDIRSTQGRRRVTLTLTPSFAASWLMPRLRDLERKHPDLELNLVTTTRVVDMGRENIDLAIRRGKGGWSGLCTESLLSEDIVPVLSPDLWGAISGGEFSDAMTSTRALVNTTLLTEWDDLCAALGIKPPGPRHRFNLDTYELSIQAACDGLGIALGRRPLVDNLLESGELVSPFEGMNSGGVSYFLLWREGMELSAATRTLVEWILTHKAVN